MRPVTKHRSAAQRHQNRAKNSNDHEREARVHPAQPSHIVVVPAMEPKASTSPSQAT